MAPTGEDIPPPFQFSLWQLLIAIPTIALALAVVLNLRSELPYRTGRILSPLVAAAAGYAIGHVSIHVARPTFSRRRVRLAVSVAAATMTVISAYVLWADWRVHGWWHELTRPWPYPDQLIHRWAEWLDKRNPPPPGHFKIHGEYDAVSEYLDAMRLARIAATCSLAAAMTPQWPHKLHRFGRRIKGSAS